MAKNKIVVNVGSTKPERLDPEEVAAMVAYNYKYTFKQALAIPHAHAVRLLKVARKEQNMKYYNLTQVAMAPHADKTSRKNILDNFKKGSK